MERNLGELSYNPKTLIPLYNGEGPNHFWDFMQSKIKQNIVTACYNDALTVQQISLETGIPLPYLDNEIKELENRKIIIKDGNHYKANVIIITAECTDEIDREVAKYHNQIADKIEAFLKEKMGWYRDIGFYGSDFSENSLRWQLSTILFRMILGTYAWTTKDAPRTAWGESAFLWLIEKMNTNMAFNFCDIPGKDEDRMYFFDYQKDGKGDHRDFYRNMRYVNIFCDICRGKNTTVSEYDLESIAEMIKKGYVVKENEIYRATVPVYTMEQHKTIVTAIKEFISVEFASIMEEMDGIATRILSAYTPKHLQNQVKGIAAMDKFVNAVCIPATILIERQFLSTAWHPLEMPTTYVVLNK